MKDPRVDNLARILVGYSTQGGGGRHLPDRGAVAPPSRWSRPSIEQVLQAGGLPVVSLSFDGQQASYFKHASDAQLDWISPLQRVGERGGRLPDRDLGRHEHPRALQRRSRSARRGAATRPAS